MFSDIIGAAALILAAMIAGGFGHHLWRRNREDEYKAYEAAMDALISVMREANKTDTSPLTAITILNRLRDNHDLDAVIASFYILRRRKMIRWEDNNILKPAHEISFVIN